MSEIKTSYYSNFSSLLFSGALSPEEFELSGLQIPAGVSVIENPGSLAKTWNGRELVPLDPGAPATGFTSSQSGRIPVLWLIAVNLSLVSAVLLILYLRSRRRSSH